MIIIKNKENKKITITMRIEIIIMEKKIKNILKKRNQKNIKKIVLIMKNKINLEIKGIIKRIIIKNNRMAAVKVKVEDITIKIINTVVKSHKNMMQIMMIIIIMVAVGQNIITKEIKDHRRNILSFINLKKKIIILRKKSKNKKKRKNEKILKKNLNKQKKNNMLVVITLKKKKMNKSLNKLMKVVRINQGMRKKKIRVDINIINMMIKNINKKSKITNLEKNLIMRKIINLHNIMKLLINIKKNHTNQLKNHTIKKKININLENNMIMKNPSKLNIKKKKNKIKIILKNKSLIILNKSKIKNFM